jgi:flagellar basal-body rod modification protein FlgD
MERAQRDHQADRDLDVTGTSGQFSWDGTSSSGTKYTDGLYQLTLSGTTDAGAKITTTAKAIGKVTDVQMLNGAPVVSVNGAQYPTSMILRIAK